MKEKKEDAFYMSIDAAFINYMAQIKQVFIYLIDQCNLDCKQCLYKPNNYFYLKRKEIDLFEAMNLLHDFRVMGAEKLTLMGGEPTLYGIEQNNVPLLRLIEYSKSIGYNYIRIDTNGVFNSSLLSEERFKLLDEITFSLDGPNAIINDSVRGIGVFDKCTSNIRKAVSLGYNCHITCCIHKDLIKRNTSNITALEEMIGFAQELGVASLNFHDLFKSGIPRDAWTGDIGIKWEEWIEIWPEVIKLIKKHSSNIKVRIPQGLVSKDDFYKNIEYYSYCSAKNGDRILIHPDGILRICSLMIGTPYGIARYHEGKIEWDYGYTNELGDQLLDEMTPCTHQYKNRHLENCVPLCVSFKPMQDEYVWNRMGWEDRFKKI